MVYHLPDNEIFYEALYSLQCHFSITFHRDSDFSMALRHPQKRYNSLILQNADLYGSSGLPNFFYFNNLNIVSNWNIQVNNWDIPVTNLNI